MDKNEFNIEYFKSIRQEINDRIKIHFTVLGTKFLGTGAVFSFMWKDSANDPHMRMAALVVSSLLAFLLDVLMLENLGWIKGAGQFMLHHVEDDPGTVGIYPNKNGILRWEHFFAQPAGQWVCFSPLGYLFGIWSVGFLLFSAAIVTVPTFFDASHNKGLVPFAVALLGYCSISYAYVPRRWFVGFGTLLLVVVLFLINAVLIRPSMTEVLVLAALTANGVFSGYTLRLIKINLGDFKLREAMAVLLGVKRQKRRKGKKRHARDDGGS